ncbi:MAG: hypothetical protein GY819_13115 [Planctomycetaceae bacterium]|nr:hypothetical protein [Planctomycetaceae bacterium]
MSRIFNSEQLADRAEDLTSHNGIERVFVTLDELSTPPAFTWLEVEFYNAVALAAIVNDIDAATKKPADIFAIGGGSRIRGDALPDRGQIHVAEVAAVAGANNLRLKVTPVGDYSTYQLKIIDASYAFDPLFNSANFKFRPGCFNTNCAPLSSYDAANDEPTIDYLAKDFHSFKHLLINAMRERVPDWEPTSEADLDQVIIDLIAADADELSDFQDRVMNEAYFGRARKRVSLARYARQMDYHIHQGNRASTWLALEVDSNITLDKSLNVWTGHKWQDDGAVIFTSEHSIEPEQQQEIFAGLNELKLYTWDNTVTALEAGATEADVIDSDVGMTEVQANSLRDLFRHTHVRHLLIEQKLNPDTGTKNGVDKTARQIVKLLEGDAAAESAEDPVRQEWFVRVFWRESDQLERRYCFVSQCPGAEPKEDISKFHGNLIKVNHGRPHVVKFQPEGKPFAATEIDDDTEIEKKEFHHYLPLTNLQLVRGRSEGSVEQLPVLLDIPHKHLAYQDTDPGGECRTWSSLKVKVEGFNDAWSEQPDLIESKKSDPHYIVETDELNRSQIRFGNNINGRALPKGAAVTCSYQVSIGMAGNVGADTLTSVENSAINKVWNPLDVDNGRAPELPEQIIRRVPQAYRARQLRAVTLEDYVKRAEELPAVSHAHARYAWTGSWRTVRVAIDLRAGYGWDDENQSIKAHLDSVRLIGEDLEVREASFASLDILLRLCAHPDYWPEDLAYELAAEFSEGYNERGQAGFFHPDLWTFGQTVHASQIIGRALSVTGVERVLLLSMRHWHSVSGPSTDVVTITPEQLPVNEVDSIAVEPWKIIRVASDPNHLERGRIQFDIQGGRR